MALLSPARLRRSRAVDRLVAAIITTGGGFVLVAVALLVVFLLRESLPLFSRGSAAEGGAAKAGASARVLLVLEDEYRETTLVIDAAGSARVLRDGQQARHEPLPELHAPLATALASADGALVAALETSGVVHVWSYRAAVSWHGQDRLITPELRSCGARALGGDGALLAVAGEPSAPKALVVVDGEARVLPLGSEDAPAVRLPLGGAALAGALASDASEAWVASAQELGWWPLQGDELALQPAATVPIAVAPTAMAMLLGNVTCLLGDARGVVSAWQVLPTAVVGGKALDLAAVFAGRGAVAGLSPSQRDKSFLMLRPGAAELAHLTTRRTLARVDAPADTTLARLTARRDGFTLAGASGEVRHFAIDAPHPEVSAANLLLPVRYEGYREGQLTWQSSGGTDAFEPKLSLVPLIVGTLKGALYALLLSAPCALAAALYVSQFASPRLRGVAKPVVELMAALPSVVVGFLAAFLLAPVVQANLVSIVMAFALAPVVIVLAAIAWQKAPVAWRRNPRPTVELAAVGAVLTLAIAVSVSLGPRIEVVFFGGDVMHFLLDSFGVTYDQRNALVVGFALGFAVIPIIFTLAEDAFSNVPPSLVSASLALGASRWQAARTVVLPAASPGLFAAVMTGLGRAVGETMIVLMATGNTPILSMSPFDGMRTLAANIAVELPEAPYGGSLYRVLMLTALGLFAMTFVINTVAVLVAERLRKRFGRLAA